MLKIVMIFVLLSLIAPNYVVQVEAAEKESVTIAMRNNALNAAIHFFSAQKKCKKDEMSEYSIELHNIENRNNSNQTDCEKNPLQKAEVTDLIVVSSDLALVSVTLDFEDQAIVQTIPVIKREGKWRIVKGLYRSQADEKRINTDILDGIKGYFSSIKSGNEAALRKYAIKLSKDHKQIENLEKISSLDYHVHHLTMLTNTAVIADISVTIDNQANMIKYVVYKMDNNWKVIADRHLVKGVIPKTRNPVEVK
ncbi:hypothetical protein WQ54_10040 [Bacillus sp. SA1-12]|uniref:hypothetical protein n=1 Tax=Bacillus sp. SA1-12 TaxID=1455638 RepID=UPI0006263E0D|nr:hypothetical protein [Bacillus sp. SA1-12]KKI92323.1 hypothetical protein WQ54_10040 [Bacillus sp. SA1-12]